MPVQKNKVNFNDRKKSFSASKTMNRALNIYIYIRCRKRPHLN
jgi:hypothetical protein